MMSRQIPRVGQQRCRLHKTKYSDVTLSSNLSWNYPVQFSCVFCCSRGSHNCGPVWVQCRSNPEWQGNDGVMYRSEYIHTHTHQCQVCVAVWSHTAAGSSAVFSLTLSSRPGAAAPSNTPSFSHDSHCCSWRCSMFWVWHGERYSWRVHQRHLLNATTYYLWTDLNLSSLLTII